MGFFSTVAFGLAILTLALAARDQKGAARYFDQYDDIRRQEVVEVAPGGSATITGLYTRVAPKSKWPGGVLHWEYAANNNFTADEKALIVSSMGQMTRRTCLKIVARTTETAYVSIKNNEEGCWAELGFLGKKQDVNLANGCLETKIIIHELMHSLGFEHEQTRYDRDMYLQVLWQNIEPAKASNFNKQPRTLSFPKYDLDFRSVMMYGLTAFSLNDTALAAMKVLKNPAAVPEAKIGASVNMTDSDVARIKSAYKCPAVLKIKSIGTLENHIEKSNTYNNFF